MSYTVSTRDAPMSARVDYWQHAVDGMLLPLRGRHHATRDFRAEMVIGDIGAVRVAKATTPGGECYRTPKLIRQADPDVYEIDVIDSGRVVAEQDGRQARLDVGDITFVDRG
jgi:hypothetical protein